ncbi:trehalase-domain-containing protein [Lactifluus subvellereus]|nr:trehalase-domain-containing protein [Lactifluus subvellereus]
MSNDENSRSAPHRFLIDVEETIRLILSLGTATTNGFKAFDIRDTYMLSNLLQQLAFSRDHDRKRIVLDEACLTEHPVDRLSRMIENSCHSLARRIDGDGPEIISQPNLDVQVLPLYPDYPYFVKSLNSKPGILALAMNKPYNWDSYFISLGLLVDRQVQMAKGLIKHFIVEIKHCNKILNDSRSCHLARSQPPFLTDMALQTYDQPDRADLEANRQWLKRAIQAAIKEYHTIWFSRDRPEGVSIPPEKEATHFTQILGPYAAKHGLSINEFSERYNNETICEPELDEYFLHDRAVDISTAIREVFDDKLAFKEGFDRALFPPSIEAHTNPHCSRSRTCAWDAIDKYCWNESKSPYFDCDTVQEKQSPKKFKVLAGLVFGTGESRGKISLDRQWPPHQIMTSVGMERYGYLEDAQRLALYQPPGGHDKAARGRSHMAKEVTGLVADIESCDIMSNSNMPLSLSLLLAVGESSW